MRTRARPPEWTAEVRSVPTRTDRASGRSRRDRVRPPVEGSYNDPVRRFPRSATTGVPALGAVSNHRMDADRRDDRLEWGDMCDRTSVMSGGLRVPASAAHVASQSAPAGRERITNASAVNEGGTRWIISDRDRQRGHGRRRPFRRRSAGRDTAASGRTTS